MTKRALVKSSTSIILILMAMPASAASSVESLVNKLQTGSGNVKLGELKSKVMTNCYGGEADETTCQWTPQEFNRVTGVLITLAYHPDARIREYAAMYLRNSIDSRAIRPLSDLLTDHNSRVKAIAASTFWHVTVEKEPVNIPATLAKEIVQRLEALLIDTDAEVRQQAAGALATNGTRDSLLKLRAAHKAETDEQTKTLLAEAIQDVEKQLQRKPEAR